MTRPIGAPRLSEVQPDDVPAYLREAIRRDPELQRILAAAEDDIRERRMPEIMLPPLLYRSPEAAGIHPQHDYNATPETD
jgi:hypothetical protein